MIRETLSAVFGPALLYAAALAIACIVALCCLYPITALLVALAVLALALPCAVGAALWDALQPATKAAIRADLERKLHEIHENLDYAKDEVIAHLDSWRPLLRAIATRAIRRYHECAVCAAPTIAKTCRVALRTIGITLAAIGVVGAAIVYPPVLGVYLVLAVFCVGATIQFSLSRKTKTLRPA